MKNFIFLFLFSSVLFIACKVSQSKVSYSIDDTFGTEAHYQKYQRNIDRLYHMLQGTYVHYMSPNENQSSSSVWLVNNNQDSVIYYILPVKEPAKDGYWLFWYQFMTSLPNSPIYCAFEKIKEIDRDTFIGEIFAPSTTPTLDQIKNAPEKFFKSINLKELKSKNEFVTYYREEITVFKAFSTIYKDFQTDNYRQDFYTFTPQYQNFRSRFYDDIKGKINPRTSESVNFQNRIRKKEVPILN